MKSWVAMFMAACLVGSEIPAFAQFNSLENGGPIARSAMREAARLGMLDPRPPALDGQWNSVRRITPGTEIAVNATGMSAERVYFLSADDASLTVLTLTKDVSSSERAALVRVASAYPQFLTSTSGARGLVVGDVRIAQGALFKNNESVAIASTIRADSVSEIRRRPTMHGSKAGAVGGALGGFALGLVFLYANLETRCQPHCGWIESAPFTFSAGLGTLGYFGFASRSDGVIYKK